jgi:hypothetical protein
MKLSNIRSEAKGLTTWGCMWKEGECLLDDHKVPIKRFKCTGENGEEVAIQSRITAYWPDGSAKWTAHTGDAGKLGKEICVELTDGGEKVRTENPISLTETEDHYVIKAGDMVLTVSKQGENLVDQVTVGDVVKLRKIQPVLQLEEPVTVDGNAGRVTKHYHGLIENVQPEEFGDLMAVLRFEGCHVNAKGEKKIPFIIRMTLSADLKDLQFMHTFLYDGDENKDYLKGIGISFEAAMCGPLYNRHVKFMGDHGVWHEELVALRSWRPRVPVGIYEAQHRGECLQLSGENLKIIDRVMAATPYWSDYRICQDSVSHFKIQKKIAADNCCFIDCLHGESSEGGAAFGSEAGSVLMSIRDFTEKYPTGYEWQGLDKDFVKASMYFWSPQAEAMDFRHYENRGYNQVCYEGYDYKGADPVGIACTNECAIRIQEGVIPSDHEVTDFCHHVNKPALYVGSPEFYHERRAFGYWSLQSDNLSEKSEMEQWLEKQLDAAADFYLQEVKQRGWYGMFNYGDFMHTYDPIRHQWRYDMGGYAWDNTELVPTLWLWYYFMRSGREDVFTLAEKLCRHASEVDVYHFGKYKGLGSRHNVRHWGCPCKEARIAMAAHHRFLYYLTGDRRLEDIFDELKDNELSFLNKDPLGDFYDKSKMVYPSHARSGPDWSSLCSNWMTQWERTEDTAYRDKILTGLNDIKKAPLQLVSGPDFEFDPESCHLRYIGERTTGGTHLQVCMGGPSVWLETADLLEDEEFHKMLADLGRFYYLPRERQLEESGGLIGDREFTLPFMCAALGAYGAYYKKDKWLAKRTWQILLETMIRENRNEGFKTEYLTDCGNREKLKEIPWISTNFAAQWCLNVIMVLDFIREDLPKTMEEAEILTQGGDEFYFHKA